MHRSRGRYSLPDYVSL